MPAPSRAIPAAFVLSLAMLASPAGALTVSYSDIVPDAERVRFNGFEAHPSPDPGAGTDGPVYGEDGIAVSQINGDGDAIWTSYADWGQDGARSWYPNGGDRGYTRITESGGGGFTVLGLLVGSGAGPGAVLWRLRAGHAIIAEGGFLTDGLAQYLGFSDTLFSALELRTAGALGDDFDDGGANALALDSIEVGAPLQPVALPGGVVLLCSGAGLLGLAAIRRRRGSRRTGPEPARKPHPRTGALPRTPG